MKRVLLILLTLYVNLLYASSISAEQDSPENLVFIDKSLPDYDKLANWIDMPSSAVIFIDPVHYEGLLKVTLEIEKYEGIKSVHIVSHGKAATLMIGETNFWGNDLFANEEVFQKWKTHISPGADLMLYGCSVAATTDGETLADNLASITGMDVAASTNLTGNTLLGGDWNFEYETGNIETSLAFSTEIENYQYTLQGLNYADLRNYTPVDEGNAGDGVWSYPDGSGRTAYQSNNTSRPVYLLSDETGVINSVFKGTIKVDASQTDNDDIGFAFGFQSTTNTYIWSWDDNGIPYGSIRSNGGHLLYKKTALASGFTTLPGTLLGAVNATSERWTGGITYQIEILYTENRIRVKVNGEEKFDVSATDAGVASFPAGRFGFYNYSQGNVTFGNVQSAPGSDTPVPPTAQDDSYGMEPNSVLNVDWLDGILKNDYDANLDNFSIVQVTDVSHGTLNLDLSDGSFSYAPAANYQGPDQFTYKLVEEGTGEESSVRTVSIGVISNNEGPTDIQLSNSAISEGAANNTIIGTFTTTDPNNPNDVHDYALIDNGGGRFTVSGDNLVVANTTLITAGSYSITVRSTDLLGLSVESPFSVTVISNNKPTSENSSVTMNEASSYVFQSSDFPFNDTDGDTFGGIRIEGIETAGDLEYDGSDVFSQTVVSDISLLVFKASVQVSGTPYATFTFKVLDSRGGISDNTYTMSIQVNDVPHNPTGANQSVTINEDNSHTFSASDFTFSDGDNEAFNGIRVISAATEGELLYNNSSVASNQVCSSVGLLVFTPVADENGTSYSTFTFKVIDSNGDESDATYTYTINVTAVNDNPVAIAPTYPTVKEDDADVALADNIEISDVDGDIQTVTFAITGGTLTIGATGITFGGSGNGSSGFTASGTLSAINTALDEATFTPFANLYGTNAGTIAITSNDGTVNSNSASVTFNIAGVNDDPEISGLPASITVTEDVAGNVDLSSATFSDIDAGAGDLTLDLSVTSGAFSASSSGGVTVSGSGTDALTLTGTNSGIDTYLNTVSNIKYTGDQNNNGTNAASLTLIANDGGNTGEGGGSDVSLGIVNINITAVNDAPTSSNFSTTSGPYQNIVYSFSTSDFDYSDVENEPLDHIRIISVPGNGVLFIDANNNGGYDSGEELSNDWLVTKAGLDSGELQYYTTGTASTSFIYQVNDGTQYSSSSYTATLNVISEPTVTLSAGVANIDETGGSTNVTATLSHEYPETVTIDLAFSGTAVLTDDYTRSGTSIAISSGTTGSIAISSASDILDEDNETVIVDIDGVSNGSENGTQQETVTITDDDATPTISFTAATQSSIDEAGTMTLSVQLSDVSGRDVTIPFIVNGLSTATGGGTDYTITASPLTIAAGNTSAEIIISVASDALDEDNETVILDMGTPTNAIPGVTTTHTAVITDDDATPTVSFTAATQSSIDEAGTMAISAQLSAVSGRDVTIPFSVNESGSATGGGTDFTITGSPVTIAAGSTSTEITISVASDALDEYDETIVVDMGNPINAIRRAITTHTATITDDDATPSVTFTSTSQVNANESGTSNITVQLSALSGRDVTVPFTVNGSGTATGGGTDYSIAASPLIIPAGNISSNIGIAVTPDLMDEYDETVVVDMETPVNATQGATTSHIINISDNDPMPTVTLGVSSSEIAEEAGVTTITGTLSAVSAKAITINLGYSGTATGGGTDYHVTGSSISISPGANSGTATLTTDQDLLVEGEETVVIDILSCDNGVESGTQKESVTIIDDDAYPVVVTTTVSNHGATSANMGGNVTNSGSADIIARGVVYSSTDTDPEDGDAGTITNSNDSGTGSFSENISGLSPNTTYYVKAYATSIIGTSYGEVEHFTTYHLPEAVCKDISVELDDNGLTSIEFSDVDNGSGAESGIQSKSLSNYVFDCTEIGDNVVTLKITDADGNIAQCNATVTVIDRIVPVGTPVEDVMVELEQGECETAIDYPEITFTDNCRTQLELVSGLGPDEFFPVGTTTEIWAGSDKSGNTTLVSFDVVVTGTNALPTIDPIDNILIKRYTSSFSVPITGISGGDDCYPGDVTISATADNTALVTSAEVNYSEGSTGGLELTIASEVNGTSEVRVTVEDSEGTTTERSFKLTIDTKNDPPFVVMPIDDQTVHASYVLKVPVSSVMGELFDDTDDNSLAIDVMEEGTDSIPSWATYAGDTLLCTPAIEDVGCVNIVVQAADSEGATVADTFQVCVEGYPTDIDETGSEVFEVQMYPNPTKGMVNLDIKTLEVKDAELSVVDITGRVVMKQKFSVAETLHFDMSNKISGMYFVYLNFGSTQIIKKLIVNRE